MAFWYSKHLGGKAQKSYFRRMTADPSIDAFATKTFLLLFLRQVFDLHSGPKPVVFVLHSFLSAKLTRMGLLT